MFSLSDGVVYSNRTLGTMTAGDVAVAGSQRMLLASRSTTTLSVGILFGYIVEDEWVPTFS